jgi:hypothetical protein
LTNLTSILLSQQGELTDIRLAIKTFDEGNRAQVSGHWK